MFSAASKTGSQPAAAPNFVEDVFSTYLYTGNSATQTINNGIDLAGKGGLVWLKGRTIPFDHELSSTNFATAFGGAQGALTSNKTTALAASDVTGYTSTGFNLGYITALGNFGGEPYCSWTFAEQPKFFDVVTYTGNGVANRQISHNLGSIPGMVIVKSTTSADAWVVYHRSLGAQGNFLILNSTAAVDTRFASFWGTTPFSSTTFSVSDFNEMNGSGNTYVAYLFAHNAGGFGTSGTDNVISCGSFTTNGSGSATVSLGYEPQYLMFKSTGTQNWFVVDVMRGFSYSAALNLKPNTSGAQADFGPNAVTPTATGFVINAALSASQDYIYMAIRRPMKVPTTGSSVFAPFNTSVTSKPLSFNTNFPVDFALTRRSNGIDGQQITSRLQGGFYLDSTSTSAESTATYFTFDSNTSISSTYYNTGFGSVQSMDAFRRASGFMDVVCYTGNGSSNTLAHNLTVAPELIIIKSRSNTFDWQTGSNFTGSNFVYSQISSDGAGTTFLYTTGVVFSAQPTASSVFLNSSGGSNSSGATYIAYLFATCPGVSKVGSYTGNGGTQAIACGFTGGARFVLIKRTDSTGDWYVYDTARGMTLLTDPYLRLNSTAAEVATLGSVTTTTGGFTVDASILAAINTNAASYIFLAIA